MSVNKVILVGNVGKDPEVRHLDGGASVASFSLATSESYKNKAGERVTQTEWHNIVAWRHLADLSEKYIVKGKQLYIEGRINNRTWEDKEGNKRYTTDIVATSIIFIGRKGDDAGYSAPDAASNKASQKSDANADDSPIVEQEAADDDLPF